MAKNTDDFLMDEGEVDDSDSVFDLSTVPDEIVYETWPEGIYDAKVEDVEYGSSKAGNPMLTWKLKARNAEGDTRTMRNYIVLGDERGLINVKRAAKALLTTDEFDEVVGAFNPNRAGSIFAGRECRVRVGINTYDGKRFNNVKEILPPAEDDDF